MSARTTLTDTEITFLNRQRVAHLATTNAQGSPSLIPICYAFDGTYFYSPLDEKPKRVKEEELQRVRNITAHGEVALLIDHYEEDWSQLGYLLIHSTARLLKPEDESHAHAIKLLRNRYIQYRAMPLEQHLVIEMTPTSITSWGSAVHK